MTGLKKFLSKKINSKFEKMLREKSFPKKNISLFQKKIIQWSIKKRLKNENWDQQIQSPVSQFTHPESRNILKEIISYNPNNLGNWSLEKPFHLSGLLEKKTIQYISNLLNSQNSKTGGYLTSGGTEANIFSMWLGRNFLKRKTDVRKMTVIKTGLTHYSIAKAADVTNIDIVDTSISSKNWGMDPIFFKETIKKEYKKGKRGFLIPLTIGYTITGSDDPIEEIDKAISELKKELRGADFFCWIDAAFSGIIKPFIEPKFSPFKYKNVSAFLTDFHKFPAIPYPSGIILYRNSLIKNIEKEVSYIGRKDTTLLGSRSGISAITTWYCLKTINKNGFKKLIQKSLKDKREFINKIKNKSPKIKIITNENSVQAGIYTNNKKEEKLLKKMKLEPAIENIILDGKRKKITIYKLFFLPFFK